MYTSITGWSYDYTTPSFEALTYSPKGLYLTFAAGWLPVPELWSDSYEFTYAKGWETKITNGGVVLCDHGIIITTNDKINRCIGNLPEANYIMKHKYFRNSITV